MSKQGTVLVEGNEEPLPLRLFDSAPAPLPVAFSTYVPQDMLAEPSSHAAGQAVRFVANFGGARQNHAFIEVWFHPKVATEGAARSAAGKAVPAGVSLKRTAAPSRQFAWSLAEWSFQYTSKGAGRVNGVTALGRHGDHYFQLTVQNPREYTASSCCWVIQ